MNYIHSKKDRFERPRGCVGDLNQNRKIEWKGKIWSATEIAASIPAEDRQSLRRGKKQQWCTCTGHIPEVKHKIRLVFIWNKKQDPKLRKVLVTNRVTWEVCRILQVYRSRWTGTETFHRDGKQKLGKRLRFWFGAYPE